MSRHASYDKWIGFIITSTLCGWHAFCVLDSRMGMHLRIPQRIQHNNELPFAEARNHEQKTKKASNASRTHVVFIKLWVMKYHSLNGHRRSDENPSQTAAEWENKTKLKIITKKKTTTTRMFCIFYSNRVLRNFPFRSVCNNIFFFI